MSTRYEASDAIHSEEKMLKNPSIKKTSPSSNDMVYQSRAFENNYKKSSSLSLDPEVDYYQTVKSLIYSGKLHEAKAILNFVHTENNLSKFEKNIDEFRVLVFEGNWHSALKLGTELLMNHVSEVSKAPLLQGMATIHLECRRKEEFQNYLQLLHDQLEVFPNATLQFYADLMQAKMFYYFDDQDAFQFTHENLIHKYSSSIPLQADALLGWIRHLTHQARMTKSFELETRLLMTQVRLADVYGNKIYKNFALSDLMDRFPEQASFFASQGDQEILDSNRIKTKVKLAPFSSPENSTFSKKKFVEILNLQTLYFKDFKILWDLESKKIFSVSDQESLCKTFESIKLNHPIKKDRLMSTIWSISTYHPHKHSSNIRVHLVRLRKLISSPILNMDDQVLIQNTLSI